MYTCVNVQPPTTAQAYMKSAAVIYMCMHLCIYLFIYEPERVRVNP